MKERETLEQGIVAAALGPVESGEQGTALQRFRFGDEFPGFQGHFPGYPILPGVVQLLMAKVTVEGWKEAFLDLKSVKNAKFLQPLRPDQDVEVRCRQKEEGGELMLVEARLMAGEELASSFLLTLVSRGGRL